MAKVKEIVDVVKLQLNAGKANPAPPVGSALGPKGINIPEFCKQFNDKTSDKIGFIIPVEISIYADRTFSFVLKTPPASDLLKKAAKIQSGAANSKKDVAGKVSKAQIQEIAETKMQDLNASSIESAMKIISGTARSMGIKIED